jgi:16S rRNA (guanine(527)-N(7))-methyltransferase RsmG
MMENGKMKAEAVLKKIPSISTRLGIESYTLFLNELMDRNQALGLMSKQSAVTIAAKLTELSVDMWDFLQMKGVLPATTWGMRMIDIGSGGGFPGIIWKLLTPELEAVLLERKGRRVDFLQRLILLLKLEHISVEEGDVRQIAWREAYKGTFDIAVMLAVAPPEVLAGSIEILLKKSGVLCAVKSRGAKDIPAALGKSLQLESTDRKDKATLFAYRKVL